MNNKILLITLVSFFTSNLFASTDQTGLNQKSLKTEKHKSESSLSEKGSFGHNMTPNSYTLNQGECAAGLYAIACGVTDNILIGSSTWLYMSYNMYSGFVRANYELNSEWTIGAQTAYLKTYEETSKPIPYQMESVRSHFILSQKITSDLTAHYNLTHEYFYDETIPHSFRREPLNEDPHQTTLSVLLENSIRKDINLNYELGVHGLNYLYPQLLLGSSISRKIGNLAFQLGISINTTPKAIFEGRSENNQKYVQPNNETMQRDLSIHPECQIQYFF